jgi:hypothetical protein
VQLQNFSYRISQVQEHELPLSNYLDRTTLYKNFAQLLTKRRPKRTCSTEVQGSDHLYLTSCRDDDIHQSTMSMPAQDQSHCWDNRGTYSTADTNSTACPGAVQPRTKGLSDLIDRSFDNHSRAQTALLRMHRMHRASSYVNLISRSSTQGICINKRYALLQTCPCRK